MSSQYGKRDKPRPVSTGHTRDAAAGLQSRDCLSWGGAGRRGAARAGAPPCSSSSSWESLEPFSSPSPAPEGAPQS